MFIVDGVRTGIGRGHPTKSQYRDTHPNELLGACFSALLTRTSVPAQAVSSVISGCVLAHGEQSANVTRNAWLQAQLNSEVPAVTVDCQCGSGQQAVALAAASIAAGLGQVAIAGGVEHMAHISFQAEDAIVEQFGTPWPASLRESFDLVPQGIAAERVAERWSVPRSELDELSLRSHRLAAAAHEAGRYGGEIVGVSVDGHQVVIDQGIRPDTSLAALAELPAAFEPGGQITAGNSSQVSSGAAALLLADQEAVSRYQLRPLARIVDHVLVGSDPVLMLTGPVGATQALLKRNGMTVDDIGRFEVNEAFASVLAMWARELEPDMERVNANGGAIALGHPLGASGARLLASLTHELQRADAEFGLVTMCCRGGLGTATLLRRV